MTVSFEGKVAIVTGAGAGLGRCHALELAKRGAKVVVNDLGGSVDGSGGSSDAAKKVVEEIKAMGGQAIANGASVADKVGAESIVKDAVNAFGTVDILINNAALYHDIDNTDTSYEYLLKVTAVNQHGAWIMGRAAAPVMVAQQWGRIVNQASGAAYSYMFPPMDFTGLGNYSYSITKWGIVGLTKFMAAQLGQYGITVNCVAPGVTMTEATKKVVPEEFLAGMTAMTAMKQRLEPEDLAGAAVFFASDDARFCTGQTLVIDGGLSMPA